LLYDNAIADFHQGTQMISEYAGVYEQEGIVQYIANRLPIFAHGKDDLHSFRYITSNLIHQKLCRKVDIERGFHVNPDTVSCWYKKFKEQGERAFFNQDNRKGTAHKIFWRTQRTYSKETG
jgi:hypothetical protein